MPDPSRETSSRRAPVGPVPTVPNLVTFGRIILAYVTLVLFQAGFGLRVTALVLTLLVICLDSVDGYLARKLGVASDFGALFDITGDRIVEHVYWVFYAFMGLISFWVPVILISRSFLVDGVRSAAYAKSGRTPFGEKSMMRSPVTRFLTASRFSRGLYGAGKGLAFALLAAIIVSQAEPMPLDRWVTPQLIDGLRILTKVVVWMVVAMNLIRGVPVLVDGRVYLLDKYHVQETRDES